MSLLLLWQKSSGGNFYARTADDSLSTLTESVSRATSPARTSSDSLATLTESVSRLATMARTAADSLSAISEAVVASKLFVRTATDSISAISDVVTRLLTGARTLADSLSTITERFHGSSTITSVTIYSDPSHTGPIISIDSRDNGTNNYATARDGTGVVETSGVAFHIAEQKFTGGNQYTVTEGFFAFDTSSIPTGSVVVSATFNGYGGTAGALYGSTAPAQNYEIRVDDFGGYPPTTGDYVAGGSLAAMTLVATVPSTSFLSASTSISVSILASTIVVAGQTRYVAAPERLRTNNAPSSGSINNETMVVWSSKQSFDIFGDNRQSPHLTINYISPYDNYIRTAADTISSLSEAVTRIWTGARTAADSVATSITESVEAIKNAIIRTAADSLSSISETTIRLVTVPRTVADSISSISEAVSGITVILRTVADSISAVSESISTARSFLRSLADLIASIVEHVTGQLPYDPNEPTVTDVLIDGSSIWDDVLFETARFESQVNGVAGTCYFRVRDEDRTKSFTPGAPLLLTINGENVWRGFVATVTRTYVFPALNVDDFGLARFIDITGMDINILLTKRIVFNQSAGANITAPLLPAHTPDVTAIDDLLDDWLDLSGDGLDTSSYVENVGDTTWTQSGRAWEGSDTWAQAMQSIASLPAAIYYIDPDKNFVYTDVDTPTARFGLSDQYDGVTTFGYREMEVLKDGTSLANDVLAWGMGYGSNKPVFDRETDATSQSIHGLWQVASLNFGVYKQATLNRIAQSIIDGSPQSKRGAKDDRVAVMCATYQHGLRVAQKVDFTSNTFGFNDVIPIRKMVVTFPGPETPRYNLILSHEIDTPLSLIDNLLFNFNFPPFGGICIPPMVMGPNGQCILPPSGPGPEECLDCGITDSFSRTTTSPDLGESDCGLSYSGSLTGGATVHADGNSGIVTLPLSGIGASSTFGATLTPAFPLWDAIATHSIQFQFDNFGDDTLADAEYIQLGFRPFGATPSSGLRVVILPSDTSLWLQGTGPTPTASAYSQITWNNDFISGTQIPITFWQPGINYTVSVHSQGTNLIGTITDGATTYSISIASVPFTINAVTFSASRNIASPFSTAVVTTISVDNLISPELTRCSTFAFDDFNRTVSNAWDGPWDSTGFTPSHASVNGTYGRMNVPAADIDTMTTTSTTGGWTTSTGFTVEALMLVDTVPGTGQDVYYEMDDENFDFTVFVEVSSDATLGRVFIGSATSDSYVKTDWQTFTIYKIKAEYIPNDVARLKVWAWQDEPEPAAWQLEVAANGPLTGAWDIIHGNQAGSTVQFRTFLLDFDYDGKPCYESGPPPVAGPVLSGEVCESQISLGSDTIVVLSAFLPKSSRVWINGELQAQSSYTENPAGASILLGSTPSPGDALRICYFSVSSSVIYSFPSSGTLSDLLTVMADMTIDIIEMASGTYHFAGTAVNIDRSARPLTVRPAAGATVTFAGDVASGGQFYFGLGGAASYITMEGFTFSGYSIGDTGIVWLGNASHITLNDMTVHTVTVTGSGPIYSWALYLSIDAGTSPSYIVADNWTVTGSSQNFSALQVGHPPSGMTSVTARDWNVTEVAYAIYAYGGVSGFTLDGWLITDSVRFGTTDTVFFGPSVTGVYSNMTAVSSGDLESQGGMTDGGGNSGL
jgi:methyl-accepting chemotaxis protein